jgi:hypothetical protein
MSDDSPDGFTMIGLHRLATASSGGPVPELYALMSQRDAVSRRPNIVEFPLQAVRRPGDVPVAVFGRDAASGRNVVAFAAPPGKTSGHFRKA